MEDTIQLEAKLMTLTSRQCKILFWLCRDQGIMVKELARHFHVSHQAIHGDIGKIYELFGLTQIKDTHAKRNLLMGTVCPIHLNLVGNPDLTCDDRLFIKGEPPPPDRETIRIVKRDLDSGLFNPRRPPQNPVKLVGSRPLTTLGLLIAIFVALVVIIILLVLLLQRQ